MPALIKLSGLFIMLTIISSCGDEQPSKTSAQIVSSFAISSSDLDIVLYGHNKVTNKAFSTKMLEQKTIDLENGDWEFKILAWEKSNVPLNGSNHCGFTRAVLAGGSVTVDIDVSPANCLDSRISHLDFINGMNFQELYIHSCESLVPIIHDGSSCTTGKGSSYKVAMRGHLPLISGETPVLDDSESLVSGCYTGPSTGLKIPAMSPYPFITKIHSYFSGDCTPGPGDKVFTFVNGVNNLLNNAKVFDSLADETVLFLKHSNQDPIIKFKPDPGDVIVANGDTVSVTVVIDDVDGSVFCDTDHIETQSSNGGISLASSSLTVSGLDCIVNTLHVGGAGDTNVVYTLTDADNGTSSISHKLTVNP